MDLQRLWIQREAQGLRELAVKRVISWRTLASVFVVFILITAPSRVRAQDSREYAVKAALLHKFVEFVEWPSEGAAELNSPIEICVLGQDPFGSTLNTIRDKVVRGRKLAIRRLAHGESLTSCNVLFISSSERSRVDEVVTSLGSSSVLTVGDMSGFAEEGGIINLVTDGNHVRFEINVRAAERARLKIASRVLNLARVIRSDKAS